MDKQTTLVAAWFGSAAISIFLAITSLIYLSVPRVVQTKSQDFRLYAALPQGNYELNTSTISKDARPKIVENFFKDYGSTLAGYSQQFIHVADKYQLDWRLLPSIAMQESNGGKKIISDSKNPFGYGIYGGMVMKFSSWEAGIERVGKALREDYLNQGLKTPTQIMAKYTPPSLTKGGPWAKGVLSFMAELR